MLLLAPRTAHAHGHVWDFGYGPSWHEGSSLWGLRLSLGITAKIEPRVPPVPPPVPPEANEKWSLLLDISDFRDKDTDTTQFAHRGGVRYAAVANSKNVLTVHALSGIVHTHKAATFATSIPVTVGGAYEWAPAGSRIAVGKFAFRLQIDHTFLVKDKQNVKNFTQFSFGLVHRFGD
jgi:hypothetical protein